MKKLIMAALLFCSFGLHAEEEVLMTKTLASTREQIKFLPLSKEDKFAIIRHAKILFSKIYVNLEHKIEIYKVNPLEKLQKLEERYEEMNEEEFQESMQAVFASAYDYHTNYAFPKPYACYTAVLPLSFRKTGAGKIIIYIVRSEMKESFPEIERLTPGDELVAYNNMDPKKVISLRKDIVAASTPDSAFMQGIYDLYYRSFAASMAPKEDDVVLHFKKPNGEIYSVKAPWMVRYTESCLNPEPKPEKESTGRKVKMGKAGDDSNVEMFQERNQFLKEVRKSYLKKFKPKLIKLNDDAIETVDLTNANKTKHPDLVWKKIQWKNESIGWLQLASFSAPDGIKAAVNEVRNVLKNNLQETKALVVDLRGNYGGLIVFAEEMAALLTPMPVKPLPFYIRANDLTLALYDSDITWKEIIMPYSETNKIVGPGTLITQEELSSVSQVYFGKVVLLTNNECFSSCDLFAAAMKDNAHVTIYGTDRSTMGGGANVWPMETMDEVFAKLDIPAKLPQGISMRITGRHAHRISSNTLIEDAGVATDIIVSETTSDILDIEHSSILAKIFNDLIDLPNLYNSDQISLNFTKEIYQRHGDEKLSIVTKPSNIEQVAIYKNKKFTQRFFIGSDNQLKLNFAIPSGAFEQNVFEIYGFSKKLGGVLPILRKSIVVESLGEFKKVENLDLIANAVFINNQNNKKCNWIKEGSDLVLVGPYCTEGKLDAVESVELSEDSRTLSFDLGLDAEPDYDFFEISISSNGVEEKLMEPVSAPTVGHFEYDISKYAGKKVDIRFRLISDEAGSGNGARVSNLKIN